jgi:hypothetical protein
MKEIAETIENDAFSMAINRDDYSKRAMDLVATIQKAYETKRLLEKQVSYFNEISINRRHFLSLAIIH